ncbi:MAG TPA: phage tail protein [Kofleriaceae bacterium]|nr:phage tail protein [Kofleriaceae bacterium]
MAANARSYTAGRFALDVDGQIAGYIKSVAGGFVKAEVATHQLGPDNVQKKHLATISHEPFTVEVGMGMTRTFYDWIRASFDKAHVTRSGEIVAANFDYEAQSARVFTDAHIAEVTIPAMDGSSKDAAYMTIKLDPERIRYEKRSGEKLKGNIGTATKKWLCSNWRFELGALPCSRVAKIDSFTWKQSIIKDEVGAFREPTKHPAKVEVPNLKLTISAADIEEWRQWHQDFVIDGKCADSDELTGALTFLGPDLVEELAEIQFDHVGIISLQDAKREANNESVARFEVELYVEAMKFDYKVSDL